MSYLWVIGGGLLQVPLIKEANKLGLKTIVSDLNTNCVAKEYADTFIHLDIFDIQAHLKYLQEHPELNIKGVLAAGIDAPETMAKMNEFLGLKGVSSHLATLTKNKHLFREKLKQLHYPMPKFFTLTQENINSKLQDLENFSFPLIVKPVDNSGSRDMKIFDSFSEVLISFIHDKLNLYPILLIEEMWSGKEQTVECLVDIKGQFHKGFITDREFTFKNGFPVELGLTHPTQLSQSTQEELYDLAKNLTQNLGITAGAVKLDTITTVNGPRVIEMAVRHSGGFDCQYLVPLSTGKNILKAAILTAIQEQFDPKLLHAQIQRYGQTASLWPEPGIIKSIEGFTKVKNIKGIEEIFMRYEVGDEIEEYIDCAKRVAFIIATGDSREEAAFSLKKAIDTIKIKTQ